jgi:protein TonB
MLKKVSLLSFLIVSTIAFSQSNDISENSDVPFAIIEKVPVFPGCKQTDNEALKNCMATGIQEHVVKKFNIDLANNLGLNEGLQRISVQFKIDNEGYVVDVRARAPHPDLEIEAVRVVESLPRMIPGTQRGENVGVLYALPIIFHVEKESKKAKKKRLRREKNKS